MEQFACGLWMKVGAFYSGTASGGQVIKLQPQASILVYKCVYATVPYNYASMFSRFTFEMKHQSR